MAVSRPARALSRDRLMIDVDRTAAPLLDARATERLIELETADVEVPPPPTATGRPPLYFRILSPSPASLRVELWELGQPYGARSVSAVGSDNLKARRIALAAAELARRLRQHRLAEIAARNRIRDSGEDERTRQAGIPIYGRFTWSAGAQGASLGGSSAWVVGPSIGAALRFSTGPRLALGAAWLAGKAAEFGATTSARWIEASLAAVEGFSVAPSVDVTAGFSFAAAAVRLGQPGGAASAAIDTWSSRAGLLSRVDARLGRYLSLSAGPDLGFILTPVSAIGNDRHEHRLNGFWLGGTVALTVDPAAP